MELEGSSLCSQEPITGHYPKPDQSSPYNPISLRLIFMLSTHLCLGLPSNLFLSGFPTEILYAFLKKEVCPKNLSKSATLCDIS
jgi:hypothetical protein